MPSVRRGTPLHLGETLSISHLYSVSVRGADCLVFATLLEMPHYVAQDSLELSVWSRLL